MIYALLGIGVLMLLVCGLLSLVHWSLGYAERLIDEGLNDR